MLPYAAYLRVYEPVIAFPEPLRSVWTAYAESSARPRRSQALAAEHEEAVRRLASATPLVAPHAESRHAYVRRAGGMTFVCPWETRLRSWLAFARLQGEGMPAGLAAALVPAAEARRVSAEFERWKAGGRTLCPHIRSSTWHIPPAWFALFDPGERCLLLGDDRSAAAELVDEPPGPRGPAGTWVAGAGAESPDSGGSNGPTTAPPTRTLIYVTTMRDARSRLARARRVAAAGPEDGPTVGELADVERWLAEFHPLALVELDYGGLVWLIDDDRLRADESVRETAVALAALERGEVELTVAMYQRLRARWRAVQALESAN